MTDGHGVNVHIPSRPAANPGRSITAYQPQEIVMFRTSTLLAIVLSVTAIASATVPAAATIGMQRGQEASHVLERRPWPKYVPYKYTTVGRSMYPIPHVRR
jgi:hypothetical protein